jgi:hypothetical protein
MWRVYHGNIRAYPGRNERGSQLAEFAPALVVLAVFVFIPLLDLTIIPIRWMMAQEIVNDYARRLALCETFSASRQTMEADPSLATRLQKLGGISVQSSDLHLRISRVYNYPHEADSLVVDVPGNIPDAWLPDGAKAPCHYSLEVSIKSLLAPAVIFPLGGATIPGLSAPVPWVITASHEWENLGRNPVTRRFFLNE